LKNSENELEKVRISLKKSEISAISAEKNAKMAEISIEELKGKLGFAEFESNGKTEFCAIFLSFLGGF
jgi:hypothetical protein